MTGKLFLNTLQKFNQEKTAMTDIKPEVVKKTRARVVEAVQEGTAQAKQTAAEVLPVVGELATKTLYNTCYYAAFGVTFAALTLARLIPKDSPVAHGLHDGTEAAVKEVEAVAEQQARMAAAAVGEGSGPVRLEGPSAT
jgi:hypothetical protein